MRSSARKTLVVAGLAATTWLAGCSDGPELGDVTGKVLQNGQPVPFAYVMFQPIDPPGTYASAYTNVDGEYELQFSPSANGAMIGRHEGDRPHVVEGRDRSRGQNDREDGRSPVAGRV